MPLWLQITTSIFSIAGVLFAIGSAILIPFIKRIKNKITTKSIVISYNAEAPKTLQGYPFPVVQAKIGITNKTTHRLNITKFELVDGKRIIPINNPKQAVNVFVDRKGSFTAEVLFVTPPPKYVMSEICTLRLQVNGIILEYSVVTNSYVAPY